MHWAARACTIKLSYSLEEQRENEQTSKASSRLVISRHRTCKCAGIIESTNESKNLTSVSANDLGICSSLAGIRASYGKSSPVSRHWRNKIGFEPSLFHILGWLPHLLDLLDHGIVSRSKEQIILQKIKARGHKNWGIPHRNWLARHNPIQEPHHLCWRICRANLREKVTRRLHRPYWASEAIEVR